MKRQTAINKVLEMMKNDMQDAYKMAHQATTCGALNLDDYEEDEYLLPKIILNVVYERLADSRAPISKQTAAEIANLRHYIY